MNVVAVLIIAFACFMAGVSYSAKHYEWMFLNIASAAMVFIVSMMFVR